MSDKGGDSKPVYSSGGGGFRTSSKKKSSSDFSSASSGGQSSGGGGFSDTPSGGGGFSGGSSDFSSDSSGGGGFRDETPPAPKPIVPSSGGGGGGGSTYISRGPRYTETIKIAEGGKHTETVEVLESTGGGSYEVRSIPKQKAEPQEAAYPYEFEAFLAQAGPRPDQPAYISSQRYMTENGQPVYLVDVNVPGEGRELMRRRLEEYGPEGYDIFEFQADTDPELEMFYYPKGILPEGGNIAGLSFKETKKKKEKKEIAELALGIDIEISDVTNLPTSKALPALSTKTPDFLSIYKKPQAQADKEITITNPFVGAVSYSESELMSTTTGAFAYGVLRARDVEAKISSPLRTKLATADIGIEKFTEYFSLSGERVVSGQRKMFGITTAEPIKETIGQFAFGFETAFFKTPEYLAKIGARAGMIGEGVLTGRGGEVASIAGGYGIGLLAGTVEFGLAASKKPETVAYTGASIAGGVAFYSTVSKLSGIGKKTETKTVSLSGKDMARMDKWFKENKGSIEASLRAKEATARTSRITSLMESSKMNKINVLAETKDALVGSYYRTKFAIQSEIKGGYKANIYAGAVQVAQGPGGMAIYQKIGFKTLEALPRATTTQKAVSAVGLFSQTMQKTPKLQITTPTTTLKEGYFVPMGRESKAKTTGKINIRHEMRIEAIELEKQQEAISFDIRHPTKQAQVELYRQQLRYGVRGRVGTRVSPAIRVIDAVGIKSPTKQLVGVKAIPRVGVGELSIERMGTPQRMRLKVIERLATPQLPKVLAGAGASTPPGYYGRRRERKGKKKKYAGYPPSLIALDVGITAPKIPVMKLLTGTGIRPVTPKWKEKMVRI